MMVDSTEPTVINIGQALIDEVPESQLQNDFRNERNNNNKIDDRSLIKNVNHKVLVDILSPEISKNEHAKRTHKFILIILLASFLIAQFYAVFLFSNKIIDYAISNISSTTMVNSLIAFLSAYITSVVVELIAILRWMVKNVFDSPIADLVKVFKDVDDNKKEQDN